VNTQEHTGCEAGSRICREHSDAVRLLGFQSGKKAQEGMHGNGQGICCML
jgi:hypothetical protein